jgi:hypothetical protein
MYLVALWRSRPRHREAVAGERPPVYHEDSKAGVERQNKDAPAAAQDGARAADAEHADGARLHGEVKDAEQNQENGDVCAVPARLHAEAAAARARGLDCTG